MKDDCIAELKELSGKKNILFVKRGNTAIKMALKLAKKLGYKKVLIQDHGGWLTYHKFVKREGLELVELKTDFGLIDLNSLNDFVDCVLLINSMPGYHALQEMQPLAEVCKEKGIFIINDVSGSIGTDQARYGDVVFGSFGDDKPVNFGKGGFISVDKQEDFDFFVGCDEEYELDFDKLFVKLDELEDHLERYEDIRNQILSDLNGKEIIHPDGKGINVIVKFSSKEEKENLIKYCSDKGFEHTLCPRYIRVNVDAISIEVKRK